MLKKLTILTVIALALCTSSYANSPIKLGVRGGINYQHATLDDIMTENYTLTTDSKVGGQLGVFVKINLMMFQIQPELNYMMNRYELSAIDINDKSVSRSIVKQNSFEAPLLMGVQLLIFRVYAGPVFHLMSESSTKNKDGVDINIDYVQKSTVSYAIGAGIELDRVSLDVRYMGNFKGPTQSIQVGNDAMKDIKTKYGNWTFSVGYSF